MKTVFFIIMLAVTPCIAEEQASAELRMIHDSFTKDVFLMAVIHSSKADLQIKGIKLFDPVANVDVTRVSDGKKYPNYAGGFYHPPYMRDFVIPAEVDDVVVLIPFPRSEILMEDKKIPGEYLFKLRYFSGKSLAVTILEDGSLVPSGDQASKQLEKAEHGGTGQPATRPESKSEGGDKARPEAEGRSR